MLREIYGEREINGYLDGKLCLLVVQCTVLVLYTVRTVPDRTITVLQYTVHQYVVLSYSTVEKHLMVVIFDELIIKRYSNRRYSKCVSVLLKYYHCADSYSEIHSIISIAVFSK